MPLPRNSAPWRSWCQGQYSTSTFHLATTVLIHTLHYKEKKKWSIRSHLTEINKKKTNQHFSELFVLSIECHSYHLTSVLNRLLISDFFCKFFQLLQAAAEKSWLENRNFFSKLSFIYVLESNTYKQEKLKIITNKNRHKKSLLLLSCPDLYGK